MKSPVKNRRGFLKCWKAIDKTQNTPGRRSFSCIDQRMMTEGYNWLLLKENGYALSMSGFRYQHFTYNGKHFYIDDLSTLPEARAKVTPAH